MGFEPMKRFWRLRALQARAFDHSAISPKIQAVKIHFFSISTTLCQKKNLVLKFGLDSRFFVYLCRIKFKLILHSKKIIFYWL